jgi:hypothetical protein
MHASNIQLGVSCRWFMVTPVKDIASPVVEHDSCTLAYSANAVNDIDKTWW